MAGCCIFGFDGIDFGGYLRFDFCSVDCGYCFVVGIDDEFYFYYFYVGYL